MLAAAPSQGQTTASISGTVRDTTGAVIPGARVMLTDVASHGQRVTQSNGEGFFSFAAVQPGRTYDLQVSMKGFETWRVTGIGVNPGDSIGINKISMKIGEVTQQVVVTATTAGVSLTSGERGQIITSEDIQRLSTVGRDVSELVKTLPGFTINAGTNVQNQAPDYELMGFGNGNLGGYGADGSAPQQGMVNIVSDSANIIDPGDMGGQIMNVNSDQVQEVNVQTADFGASESKGPVVINAVGKSGGAEYHGSLYAYARNGVLNANDWLSNYYGSARPDNRYAYPGGDIGGPVRIPGTGFNRSKKMTFWAGFEYYDQTQVNGTVESFIPNSAMLNGDFSLNTLAQALNVDPTVLTTNCQNAYTFGSLSNVGGICYVPGSTSNTVDENGNVVNAASNGQIQQTSIETAAVKAWSRFYPAANRTPRATGTEPTDGFNYVKNVMATHNGYQIHSRVDENFTDNLKLYVTYNYEAVNDESPLNNIYYNPEGTIPYPTPEFSNAYSHVLSANLTQIFGPTLTNELVASGAYFYEPGQFANRSIVQDAATGWPWPGGRLKNGTTQLPEIQDYQLGVPSYAMAYVPANSEYLRKYSWNVQDTVTKQIRTHSIKAGVYGEVTANNQVALGSPAQGSFVFASYDYCLPNYQPNGSAVTQYMDLGNAVANMLTGCAQSYSQANADLPSDLNFKTLAFFATDEWKVGKKLTLTLGLRLEHLGPWTDPHGIGLAVWEPPAAGPGSINSAINPNDPTTWPGVYWHKHSNGKDIPLSGAPSTAVFVSPRFGVAYDLFGDGKTVFRGGWGAYRSHDSYNTAAGAANATAGISTYQIPGSNGCTYEQLFEPASSVPSGTCGASASGGSDIGLFSFTALDPHDSEQPLTYNYNLTVDQEMPWNSHTEIAYSGNQSTDLATLGNLENQNVVPLRAGFQPDPITGQVVAPPNITNWSDYRPYPNYTEVYVPNHIGWSNYNSLQTSWTKQKGSVIFNANYTWSKALGVRGNYDTGYIADPIDPHHDYGVLAFNRAQAFNLSYSWQEGRVYHGSRVVQAVANGWELSGIETIQSGPDLAIINGTTNFGLSGAVSYTVPGSGTVTGYPVSAGNWLGTPDYALQPTVTCDPRLNRQSYKADGQTVKQYVNGSCFGLPTLGEQGSWNLPDVHGPAFYSSDLTVFKDFHLTERQALQIKVAGFDFLNHPLSSFNTQDQAEMDLIIQDPSNANYTNLKEALAGAIPNSGTFGRTQYKASPTENGPGRIVELGAKYTF